MNHYFTSHILILMCWGVWKSCALTAADPNVCLTEYWITKTQARTVLECCDGFKEINGQCQEYTCHWLGPWYSHRIVGYNDKELSWISVDGCKRACEKETSFTCLSFDYYPNETTSCYLSSSNQYDVTLTKLSGGDHYQINCSCHWEPLPCHQRCGYTQTGDHICSCYEGYQLQMDHTTCLATCQEPKQPNYTEPLVGEPFVRTQYLNGTVIVYNCSYGYHHNDGNQISRTCVDVDTWIGTQCEPVSCDVPVQPENTATLYASNSLVFNTSITYQCLPGYVITSGNLKRSCLPERKLTGTAPVCTATCQEPRQPKNTEPLLREPFVQTLYLNGTVIVYKCTYGYHNKNGNQISRTCVDLDTWIGPQCEPVTCDVPMQPENTVTSYPSTSFVLNTSITYQCLPGYDIASGNLERSCLPDKTLSGTPPVCTGTCDIPVQPNNTLLLATPTTLFVNLSIIYQCKQGYGITEGDLMRSCQRDRTWSGTPPVCKEMCRAVQPPNTFQTVYNETYIKGSVLQFLCNYGYHSNKSLFINKTCVDIDTWTGPECTIRHCDLPVQPHNTVVVTAPEPLVVNVSVTYQCMQGYDVIEGNLARSCQIDGTWSGTPPVCMETCRAVQPPKTIPAIFTNETYVKGSTLQYLCNYGYHSNGSTIINKTCVDIDTWTGPECEIREKCDAPIQPSHAYIISTSDYLVINTRVTYLCEQGYEITKGDLVRSCQRDGTWSGTPPICTGVKCTEPVDVDGTDATWTGTSYLDVVTYTCKYGFRLTDGHLKRTCLTNRTWSHSLPVCSALSCGLPPKAPNSTYSAVAGLPGSMAEYTCNVGFTQVAGNSTKLCTLEQEWEGQDIVCQEIFCPEPASVSNAVAQYSDTRYRSTVVYQCTQGYMMTELDSSQQMLAHSHCDSDGRWSLTAFKCSEIQCPEPLPIINTLYNYTKKSVGENAVYSCDETSHYVSGHNVSECLPTGNWTIPTITCHRVMCPVLYSSNSTEIYLSQVTLGSKLIMKCLPGYRYVAGDMSLTCVYPGVWDGISMHCQEILCPPPSNPPNSDVITQSLAPGGSVYYTCQPGFTRTAGDLVHNCSKSGQWVGADPQCAEIVCKTLNTSIEGRLHFRQDSYSVGSQLEFWCDPGMNLSSNSPLVCGQDGEWNGTLPQCYAVTCEEPPLLFHSKAIYYNLTCLTKVTYICDPGYWLSNSQTSFTLTCDENGEWSGEKLSCESLPCPTPEVILYGTFLMSDVQGQIMVTYSCDPGYYITKGNDTRTCQINGTWTGLPPTCDKVLCGRPPDIRWTTWHMPSGRQYLQAHYACLPGYHLARGKLVKHCLGPAGWSLNHPVCKESSPKSEVDILWENLTEHERFLKSIGFTEADKRPSAWSAGVIGSILVVTAVILLVSSDIPLWKKQYRYWRQNMSGFRDRVKGYRRIRRVDNESETCLKQQDTIEMDSYD